jgi:calpain-7
LKNAILATEIYMKAIKLASGGLERERLKSKCMKVLARAEEIKQLETWRVPANQNSRAGMVHDLNAPLSDRRLPTREQVILLESSKLHGFIFSPWNSEPGEEFFQSIEGNKSFLYDSSVLLKIHPHIDHCRDSPELKLSESQRKHFAGWRRPHELFRDRPHAIGMPENTIQPTMMARSNIDLMQDVTADCSVVASLCAALARPGQEFEKVRTKAVVKLLSTIFYPYDKENSRPKISESGRYVFRFQFNGCFRKVVIDDRLPASTSARTLHIIDRQNPGLLWPALLEKAYLKIRGGYDFPGSNSGTDLHVLTGWIPEQIFLQRYVPCLNSSNFTA